MQIHDPTTNEELTIRADNIVTAEDGRPTKVIEAMFSSVVDLTKPGINLMARMHPRKARAFELIVVQRDTNPELPEVEIHAGSSHTQKVVRKFSDYLEPHRELLQTGKCGTVVSTVALSGFESNAEPVLRYFEDGSLLLIFNFLPPSVIERDPERSERFMESFESDIESALGVPVVWDDRDVFVIKKPNQDTASKLKRFIQQYWENNATLRPVARWGNDQIT